ncbi:unnamed protein product [Caenorhabditis auriculariae]|uniref:Uncharacterized protein n=1 Tax=Caenorhabditis auriculariae TaxID=2777116 RepID=A0A8S1H762_9PELO|nr:unnamed protein product [Caenorhabditis auriculariae]
MTATLVEPFPMRITLNLTLPKLQVTSSKVTSPKRKPTPFTLAPIQGLTGKLCPKGLLEYCGGEHKAHRRRHVVFREQELSLNGGSEAGASQAPPEDDYIAPWHFAKYIVNFSGLFHFLKLQ